jgi:hypothetical protein
MSDRPRSTANQSMAVTRVVIVPAAMICVIESGCGWL